MISACCMLYGVSLDIVNKLQEIKDFGYLWKEFFGSLQYRDYHTSYNGIIVIESKC